MIPDYLRDQIKNDDLKFNSTNLGFFALPVYNPKTHYIDLTQSGYFRALITLRHYIKIVSDYYFGVECGAKILIYLCLLLVSHLQWVPAQIQR